MKISLIAAALFGFFAVAHAAHAQVSLDPDELAQNQAESDAKADRLHRSEEAAKSLETHSAATHVPVSSASTDGKCTKIRHYDAMTNVFMHPTCASRVNVVFWSDHTLTVFIKVDRSTTWIFVGTARPETSINIMPIGRFMSVSDGIGRPVPVNGTCEIHTRADVLYWKDVQCHASNSTGMWGFDFVTDGKQIQTALLN